MSVQVAAGYSEAVLVLLTLVVLYRVANLGCPTQHRIIVRWRNGRGSTGARFLAPTRDTTRFLGKEGWSEQGTWDSFLAISWHIYRGVVPRGGSWVNPNIYMCVQGKK